MSVFMLARRRALTAKLSLLIAAASAVCLAQFPAPSDSGQYAAKVLTLTGQVSVMKDMVPIALLEGSSVAVQQMIVTGPDGHATFQVSDGSTFEVFPNSHLVFRKNAWNVKDLIDLLVGRIRVHIEHLGTIPNPNRVMTPTAVISVRGTTFDVTVNDDDETTIVEVEDGLVEVRHALLPSDHATTVHPGETLRVYKSQPLAQNVMDKGTILRYLFNAVRDAANVASMRSVHAAGVGLGGSSGGGATGVGDTGKGQAPAPPPPPPPAPGHLLGGADDSIPAPVAAPPQHHPVRHALRVTAMWMLHQFI
ncbi:MAG TPA: FecR family protein [Bryobacteraceae bacterium]|nr:FecR family protein [Bryobacteraceae bacterium]